MQLIEERTAELPEDVRNAIQSADFEEKVRALGSKHNLHIDQVGELGDEVMLAMLGFSPLESLEGRLAEALKITPEAARALTTDVGTEILGSIRESMKRFAEEKSAAQKLPPSGEMNTTATPAGGTFAAAPAKPPVSPELHKVDVALAEKAVSLAPNEVKPIYKADPYREPV